MLAQWSDEAFMTFFTTGQLPSGGTVPPFTLPSVFLGATMSGTEVCAATTDAELRDNYSDRHRLPAVDGPPQ